MSQMTKRTELYKQLPLEVPFSIHIFVSYFCNFKCNYCLHSLNDEVLEQKKFTKAFMSFDIYKKTVDDIAKFSKKIKALIFAGHGEPLLNKDIAKMVAYAKDKNIANRIEIVTNGSLLTKDMSDALIAAGLDRLRISIQGINSQAYKKVMGKEFDFDRLVNQIKYFYEHKINTEVYCKIIDIAMQDAKEQELFKNIFQPISDEAAIEYAIPFVKEVENEKLKEDFSSSKQGNSISTAKVCSMPFYMMVVTPNGDVVPCCSTDIPLVYGNVKENSLSEIWASKRVTGFCRVHLLGNRDKHFVCKQCSVPSYGLQEGDYLDDYTDELLEKYMIK